MLFIALLHLLSHAVAPGHAALHRPRPQWHEMTLFQGSTTPVALADPLDQFQYLLAFAHRRHQPAADGQLLQQGLRHFQSGRGQDDAIEGRNCGKPSIPSP